MYQIVGHTNKGQEVDLFTWNRDPRDGIIRAMSEARQFNHDYVRYSYRTLDPS